MKMELVQQLSDTFPLLYRSRQPNHPFYIECGDGWFNLLYKLSEQLEALIQEQLKDGLPLDEALRAAQVKEKYGDLCFYTYGLETEQAENFIREANAISGVTCEECGQPGTMTHTGWIKCLCPTHMTEREKRYGS